MSNTFNPGDEIMFHIASLGAQTVPLPPAEVERTGEVISTNLNIMSGIYRGEDETFWHIDIVSFDPPLRDARLMKAGVDLIGVQSNIEIVKRQLQ